MLFRQTQVTSHSKILIIDDEPAILDIIEFIIKTKLDIEMVRAPNGNNAIELLKKDKSIGAIITDFKMNHGNGNKVLEYNLNHENLPTIILSGKSQEDMGELPYSKESKNLLFLNKPIIEEDLIRSVKNLIELNPKYHNPFKNIPFSEENRGLNLFKIPIQVLISHLSLPTDLFIKLTDQKFVKLLHKEDPLDIEILIKYRSKGERYLYLEEHEYTSFCKEQLEYLNLTIEKYHQLTQGIDSAAQTIDFLRIDLMNIGISEAQIKLVEKSVFECIENIKKEKAFSKILGALLKNKGYLISHSVTTIHIALLIAENLDFYSSTLDTKITYAAILHDLLLDDHESMVLNLDSKRYTDLDMQGQRKVTSHSVNMAKRLETKTNISSDIITMIRDHHELPDGTGFPRKIEGNSIGNLSAVFILALRVADALYHQGYSRDVIQKLSEKMRHKYDCFQFKKPLFILREKLFKQ